MGGECILLSLMLLIITGGILWIFRRACQRKEFYYLGYVQASGRAREFVMPNTDKTAVEIEWLLDVPVREDLYEYIING